MHPVGAALLLILIRLPSEMLSPHRSSLLELLPFVFYLQFADLSGATNERTIWDNLLRFLHRTGSLAVEEHFYIVGGLLFFPRRLPPVDEGRGRAELRCHRQISRASCVVVRPCGTSPWGATPCHPTVRHQTGAVARVRVHLKP